MTGSSLPLETAGSLAGELTLGSALASAHRLVFPALKSLGGKQRALLGLSPNLLGASSSLGLRHLQQTRPG